MWPSYRNIIEAWWEPRVAFAEPVMRPLCEKFQKRLNLSNTRCDRQSEASSVAGLFLNSAERDIPQCRRSLTSRPAMPASGSSGVRRARRSTIRLFQDSRCARMRGCNSQIGVSSPTRHVCSICSAVRTQDRVAGAGHACNARPPSPHDLPLIS